MSGTRENLGFGLLALLPIACCVGIPLVAAAGFSIAVVAWAGGLAAVALVLVAALALLGLRLRRRQRLAGLVPLQHAEPIMSENDCCPPTEGVTEAPAVAGRGPLVEILYFDGCPNHQPAIALVERVSRELGLERELRLVNVPDQQAAERLRFLGSPTIRVGGVDVDPRTEERDDYALSCRVFQTAAGISGQPEARWVREALLREAVAAA